MELFDRIHRNFGRFCVRNDGSHGLFRILAVLEKDPHDSVKPNLVNDVSLPSEFVFFSNENLKFCNLWSCIELIRIQFDDELAGLSQFNAFISEIIRKSMPSQQRLVSNKNSLHTIWILFILVYSEINNNIFNIPLNLSCAFKNMQHLDN